MNSTLLNTLIFYSALVTLGIVGALVVGRLLGGQARYKNQNLSLGGAAAIFFILLFLFFHYFPMISQTASTAIPVRAVGEGGGTITRAVISLEPTKQIVLPSELRELDKNVYQVDEQLGIAFNRPDGIHWEAFTADNLPGIGMADLPFFEPYKYLFVFGQTSRGAGVRELTPHELVLDEKSTINGVATTFNMYREKRILNSAIKNLTPEAAQAFTGKQFTKSDPEEQRKALSQAFAELGDRRDQLIKAKLPIKKSIYNGVIAIPLSPDLIENSFAALIQPEASLLDKAWAFVGTSGMSARGNTSDLFASEASGLISFNSSSHLAGVMLDGRETDVWVNDGGFLVARKERAVLVKFVYLSSSPATVLEALRGYLNSFRFTA